MKRLNTNEFIKIAQKIHGNVYGYTNSIYNKSKEKIIIICHKHGNFYQSPNAHLNGQGCPKCKKCYRPNTEEFIISANKIHKNVYLYFKTKYISTSHKIIITCKQHGDFVQLPSLHLTGRGCPKCAPNYRKTLEDFITRSNKIHNNYYDYSATLYNKSNEKVSIICPKHKQFLQTPSMHLAGNGCPKCKSSKGEIEISKWLSANNFVFERQKTFDRCRNPVTNAKLKFDFYVSNENILIEYDGIQHFKSNCLVGGKHRTTYKEYQNIHKKDLIKNKFAKTNKIKIIRIPYTQFNNIHNILTQHLLCQV